MKFTIINMPISEGSGKTGTQNGPNKLIEYGTVQLFKAYNQEVNDIILISKTPNKETRILDNNIINNYIDVFEYNLCLSNEIRRCFDNGTIPFVLGGDHSLGIGSLSGTIQNYEKIAVIWIDAHTDINTEKSSESGNAHGMPLSFALGLNSNKMQESLFNGKKIISENIYIIGARSIDLGEEKILIENRVNVYRMEEIRAKGLENILNSVKKSIRDKDIEYIYFSFDVDSIDPQFAPGTGTPVIGGFEIREIQTIFRELLPLKPLCYVDVVEFNPDLDIDNITLKTTMFCLEILLNIISYKW